MVLAIGASSPDRAKRQGRADALPLSLTSQRAVQYSTEYWATIIEVGVVVWAELGNIKIAREKEERKNICCVTRQTKGLDHR